MQELITPAQRIEGEVVIPGDKSISHRALMISAIAEGETHIENLCEGADVKSTIACLRNLGVQIIREGEHTVVDGAGLSGLQVPDHTLDVGNSGTTIRLLSGILAGQTFVSRITGDESIHRRPMSRIIMPLRKMGAEVTAAKGEFVPLTIEGGSLHSVSYALPLPSAQVKSCILLAGLYAPGNTEVIEPAVTRDHTELMLSKFGANVQRNGLTVSVEGDARLTARDVFVPGDISSAAFFIGAAMLAKDGGVLLKNVGINPTRRTLLSVLGEIGAELDIINVRTVENEMMADLFIKNSKLQGMTLGGDIVPQIIDEIPILSILATQADGVTEISGAGELRHKESDRLRSLKFNLDRMGAKVVETEDGLIIEGPTPLRAADIECFGDHRIAMAFAVAGLIADGETRIKGSECTDISHPDFFSTLRRLATVS